MTRSPEAMLREPGVDRHIVQVYRDPAFRDRAVAAWLGEALRRDGGGVVACRLSSAQRVLSLLGAQGVDFLGALAAGRLVILDADDLLSRFMVDGEPVASRFAPIVRDVVRGVRARCEAPGEVRAWGEMVDVLCKAGNPAAARRLEALWNDVIDEERIRLLCSYELDHLDPHAHVSALEGACAGHSVLIPEEDESALDAAVGDALVEVYGEERAPLVRAQLSTGRPYATRMPPAEALLIQANQKDALIGARLLSVVRRNLDSRRASPIR